MADYIGPLFLFFLNSTFNWVIVMMKVPLGNHYQLIYAFTNYF